MFKKTMMLAMAVGVVVAFALPATASATWKHHNTKISENVKLGFTGNLRFQGELGGLECQITARVEFEAATSTGTAETLVPHPTNETTNCKGLGGLAFCQVHDATPQEPKWTLHATAFQTPGGGAQHSNAAVITTQELTAQTTGGFCPVKHLKFGSGSLGLIPEGGVQTVTNAQLSGVLTLQAQTNAGTIDEGSVTLTGTAQIESPNQGTYSF